MDPYSRIRWSSYLNGVVCLKNPHDLTEVFTPSSVASSLAAADWTARQAESGVVVAYDFGTPANGGDWTWGSLSNSPHVSIYAENLTSYPDRTIDTDIKPPGSNQSLRWDVPDGPHGVALNFLSDAAGHMSVPLANTTFGPYPDLGSGFFTFSNGETRAVSVSSGVMSWSGALAGSPSVMSGYMATGERADGVRISLDDYADQFGDNAEFWVQWRTRMNASYATAPYLDSGGVSMTYAKQMMLSEGMQPSIDLAFTSSVGGGTSGTLTGAVTNGTYQCIFSSGETRVITVSGGTGVSWTIPIAAGTVTTAKTGELNTLSSWPAGYRGAGTSKTQNQLAGIRADFEGETNLVALAGVDQLTGTSSPPAIFKYPSSYHGKPTYITLLSGDGTSYTHHNSGTEAGPFSSAACHYQLDGNGIVNRSTCFNYPVDEWFTLMVHVKLGARGRGISLLGGAALIDRNAVRVAANQVKLTDDSYPGHFRPDIEGGMWVRITGATTGTVDAQVSVKTNDPVLSVTTLTLINATGAINNEALLVSEYENGFVNSTVEYYGAYTGGSMQLLHRRTGIVMRVGNYNYADQLSTTTASGTAKYGSFAWTTFMTSKSSTQSHPTGSVWVSQIIVKSGATPPSTPKY
jgi:hypothetical protein